nr:pentatricopeptide repeat-containing protein At4g01030, mitochondrial [Ipomoea batatas]
MEAIAQFNQFNSSILQKPFKKKQPRNYDTRFSLLNMAEMPAQTSLSASHESTSVNSLPLLTSSDDLSELQLDSLSSVKAMHARIIKMPAKFNSTAKMQSLTTSYLEVGDFTSAAVVFFVDFAENYLHWNSFLKEFRSSGGNPCQILEVFGQLHSKGVMFDSEILALVLKLCSQLKEAWLGLEVHGCLIKMGFDSNVYAKSALMNFYGRCWGAETANQVFYGTPKTGSLLWNEAILVRFRNENWIEGLEMFHEMQGRGMKANSFTIAKALQACGNLRAFDEGKQIHGYVFRNAFESNLLICNALISMYVKKSNLKPAEAVFMSMENHNLSTWNTMISGYTTHGHLNDAWKLFLELECTSIEPDIVTWNCLLSGHFYHGLYQEVLIILRRMQIVGYKPNPRSLTYVIQAISELGSLRLGKEVHCYILRNGMDHDLHVGTSVLDMYVKNDDLASAQAVFYGIKNKNIFAWNSLISGYSFNGYFEKAISFMNHMKEDGIKPDLVTYNSLVFGYSKSGHIKEALATLREIKNSGLSVNVASWTALVSGCSKNGYFKDALEFSIQMQNEGVKPNSVTTASLLRACAGLALLQKGKEIHCFSIRNGFAEDAFVSTALFDMYSKCGSIKNAYKVFQRIQNKILASWNSMLMGFATYGLGKEAISLFNKMLQEKIQPDAITFTAVLSSCKHSGLIDEGWKYFDSMKTDFGVTPTIEHYSCMVDLLGRAGFLDEAWDFVQSMPMNPDSTVWGALLASCKAHGNLELGELAAKMLFKLEPYNTANYVLMINMYAASNRWQDVSRIKEMMDTVGARTEHVWSWLQIDQKIHIFSAVGKPHPDEGIIYFELYKLISEMKLLGYVADTKCVYQNIDEPEKELLHHTEKLAITYGLIKSRNIVPAAIDIKKIGRWARNCYEKNACISTVKSCSIYTTDGVFFHLCETMLCSGWVSADGGNERYRLGFER